MVNIASIPTIRFWIQTTLICLLLYPWFKIYVFILFISSIVCYFYARYRYLAVVITTIISSIFGWGIFSYVALDPKLGKPLSILSYIICISISYLYLKSKPKAPFTQVLIFGVILIILWLNTSVFYIKRTLFGLIIMWATNFFVIIREADENYEKKSMADICTSICAPWNYPLPLNLTTKEIKHYAVSNSSEFLQTQRSAAVLLLKIVPFIFFIKIFYLIIVSEGVQNLSWSQLTLTQFEMNPILRTQMFFDIEKNIGILDTGLRYLFALIFCGVSYIFGMIYVFSCGVAVSRNFGFRTPYNMINIEMFKSPASYIQNVYYYFNRTSIQVFYLRLTKTLRKFKFIRFGKYKKVIFLYMAVLTGGVSYHIIIDIYQSIYPASIFRIIAYIPSEIPFFLLIASLVLLSKQYSRKKKEPSAIKTILLIIFTILQLCLLFSLRMTLLLQVGWREYFNIFAEIFKSLWRLLTF